ncbi:MAG: hypothetical protein ACOVSI_09145 [Gemmatimonas sp.]|jgi:hypothetical protein
MTPTRPILAASPTLTIPLALLFAACGDATPKNASASADHEAAPGSACVSLDTTPVGLAVLDYITTADPHPQRFLSAVGTDSALPDDGFKTLQDKGPTYFYTSDPKGQAQVKAKLESAGPYASMLVVYKGKTETENGNAVTVTLGGHYVGGEHEGKVAPVRQITVRCDSTGWRLPTPPATPAAPKPAAPTTADSAGKR